MKRTYLVLPLLLVWGCREPTALEPAGQKYELRMRGTRPGGYEAFYLSVRDVKVSAAGRPLPVTLQETATLMNLSQPDHASLLAYFWVPDAEAVTQVHIEATLDSHGAYQATDAAGDFRSNLTALRFDAPLAAMERNHHAVIELNLEGSLAPSGARRTLLPNTVIAY